MGILADWQIEKELGHRITPFSKQENRPGIISYGVTSYGYDARIGYKFRIFANVHCGTIDPKNFDPRCYSEVDMTNSVRNYILIPPNTLALGETVEEFDIPRDMLCVVVGKSTYARCGLIVNVTPGEPEWKGKWTVEISNTTPHPARVYCGEGIMQCLFFRSDGHREIDHTVLKNFMDKVSQYPVELVPSFSATAFDLIRMGEKEGTTCKTSYLDKKGKY